MAAIKALMVGTSPDSLVEVPTPDGITWGLQDVSSSDSGRVNDANATMYKNRVTQKRKLVLSWKNPDDLQAMAILRAFNPVYVYVRYFEPMDAEFQVRCFYSGDKSAPLSQITVGGVVYTSLSFDVIER